MMMHEKPLACFDMEDFNYGTSMPDDWEDYEQEVYLSEPSYGFDENYDPLPPEFGSDLDDSVPF